MTLIRIGLENGADGRSIAWALDYPGCFANGADAAEAIVNTAPALVKHQQWVESHTGHSWLGELGQIDFRLVEVWEVFHMNDQYEVVPAEHGSEINAWFRDDWKPLTDVEAERGLALLDWSHTDLLAVVQDLPAALMEEKRPGERWSIARILQHVATSEWWYLDQMGLAGAAVADLPADPFERLSLVRTHFRSLLPGLAGREDLFIGKKGEFWSPRKLLRRVLWHEKDHTGHISRLVLEAM